MVNEQEQDSGRRPANQGVRDVIPEPNKISASTPYDFNGRNLTPYGGLLPVIHPARWLINQTCMVRIIVCRGGCREVRTRCAFG
jgi:hypothetical protein